MKIEHKTIADLPGYRIGSDGSIWSCWGFGAKPRQTDQWRQMKAHRQKRGHMAVMLRFRDCRYVHRLVLEAFVGPCPEGQECRHLNGDPGDNRLENLVWGSPLENSLDMVKHGTSIKGTKSPKAKLKESDVLTVMSLLKDGMKDSAIAKRFGVAPGAVIAIRLGYSWNHITGLEQSEDYRQRRRAAQKRYESKLFLAPRT